MLQAAYALLVLVSLIVRKQGFLLSEDPRPFCPCHGSDSSRSVRVVGGHNAGKTHFPFAAVLMASRYSRNERWNSELCGATVITDTHVVTAAHCLENWSTRDLSLKLGGYYFHKEEGDQINKARSTLRHPDFSEYSPYFENDIALIELKHPVEWNSRIRAAWLPPSNLNLTEGTTASVYGWGRTVEDGAQSDILQTVELPVIDNKECNAHFHGIRKQHLCAGGRSGEDACQGDSGSGLVVRIGNEDVLCGIVSFGRECGTPGLPGIYTRVSSFSDWIYENTLSSSCKPCVYGADA